MKNASKCEAGGFLQFQIKLMNGEPTTCGVCRTMLENKKFNQDPLDVAMEEAVQTGRVRSLDVQDVKDVGGPPGNSEEQDKQDEEDPDPFAYARKFAPIITLLPPGEFGKTYPFRCNLCKTKSQNLGKVGDLCAAKASSVEYFLDKHLKSAKHQEELQKHLAGDQHDEQVECEGLLLSDQRAAGQLYDLREEFATWTRFANLQRFARHSYKYDANRKSWRIHAAQCLQSCEADGAGRKMCHECAKLGKASAIAKTVLKFAWKYWPARWLNTRLFHSKDALDELEVEILQSGANKADPVRMQEILGLDLWKLQQVVAAGWDSVTHESSTQAHKEFLAICIKPSIQLNVQSVPSDFQDVIARFSAALKSGRANEADSVNLRIAAAALDGRLDNHPLLQGISLQCLRLLDKQRRGIEGMTGRRSNETAKEAQLIEDAGLTFAINSNNKQLALQLLGMLLIGRRLLQLVKC